MVTFFLLPTLFSEPATQRCEKPLFGKFSKNFQSIFPCGTPRKDCYCTFVELETIGSKIIWNKLTETATVEKMKYPIKFTSVNVITCKICGNSLEQLNNRLNHQYKN